MHLPAPVLRGGLRLSRPLFASPRLSVATKRKGVDALAGGAPSPAGVTLRSGRIADLPVELAFLGSSPTSATLLYLHGGGYALGSAHGYRGFVGRLASEARMDAVIPEYSRSPEAPFPIALDEVTAIYRALVDNAGPGSVVIAGDSAGGGLALALAMRIRDLGLQAPAAVGLICPWLDLVADRNGTRRARRDPLIVPGMLRGWVDAYAADMDPADPFISPIYGDLANLPPIILHSAGDDPIAADAEALEDAVQAQGGSTTLEHRAWERRWHCFHLQAGMFRDADQALQHLGTRLADLADAAHLSGRS